MTHDHRDVSTHLNLAGYSSRKRQGREPGRKKPMLSWVHLIPFVGTLFPVLLFSLLVLTNQHPVVLEQSLSSGQVLRTQAVQDAGALNLQGSALLSFERGEQPQTRTRALAECDWSDLECHMQEALKDFAAMLFENVKPMLDSMVLDRNNFLTQTPASLTYEQGHIKWVASWALTVVELALLVLVAIAGYQIMLGRAIGLSYQDATTLLPRLMVAFILAQSWQWICGILIDLNNALCFGVLELFHTDFLVKIIESIETTLSIETPNGGVGGIVLTLVLAIFLLIQILLLLWQMLVRLALVMLLVALSPLGLASLGSSLTAHWGQLWVSLFVHTVLVQFLQVTALVLAGMLSLVIVAAPWWKMDQALVLQLVSAALFFLVLRLPTLLQAYMPSPLVGAGMATGAALSGIVKRAAAAL